MPARIRFLTSAPRPEAPRPGVLFGRMVGAPPEATIPGSFIFQLFLGMAVFMVARGDSDSALVRRCLGGDRGAFQILLDRYHRTVFNVAYRILLDYEDARDVTQEVFTKVYQNLASFDPGFRFFSWLYRCVVNECLNLTKKRKRFLEFPETMVAGGRAADERVYEGEMSRRLEGALMRVKPEQRAIIVLKHVWGFSYRDLGEIFGIPEKTVKSRLFDARRELRDILTRETF
jgi:RNA polymerase sigma-70 factor, ECF subfamily